MPHSLTKDKGLVPIVLETTPGGKEGNVSVSKTSTPTILATPQGNNISPVPSTPATNSDR